MRGAARHHLVPPFMDTLPKQNLLENTAASSLRALAENSSID